MLESLILAAVVIGLGGWAVYVDRRNQKALRIKDAENAAAFRKGEVEAVGLKAVEDALHPKKPAKKTNRKR